MVYSGNQRNFLEKRRSNVLIVQLSGIHEQIFFAGKDFESQIGLQQDGDDNYVNYDDNHIDYDDNHIDYDDNHIDYDDNSD